jgi:AraC-like DNA-binding protein
MGELGLRFEQDGRFPAVLQSARSASKPTRARGARSATSRGVGARRAVQALSDERIDPAPLIANAGLEDVDLGDREARVPATAEAKFIEGAADACGDPTFGLRLATRGGSDEMGLVFFLLSAAPSLREAVRLMPRYARIADESASFTVAFSFAKGAAIEVRYSGLLRRDLKHAAEYQLAAGVQALRDVAGHDVNPVRVSFAHLRRTETRNFERFFRCPVEFGAEADRLVFSQDALDAPNRRADPYLFETLQPFAEEEAKARNVPAQTFREAVDNALFGLLPRGEATVEAVSCRLAVSPRTLSRRLAEEGTTFPEVLAALRQILALRYIREPGLGVDQIALLLGYSELSSFSHAFRRWTGSSPSAARRACARSALGLHGSSSHPLPDA